MSIEALAEHIQHRAVFTQHLGYEVRDAVRSATSPAAR